MILIRINQGRLAADRRKERETYLFLIHIMNNVDFVCILEIDNFLNVLFTNKVASVANGVSAFKSS